jgi:hypothetical protein
MRKIIKPSLHNIKSRQWERGKDLSDKFTDGSTLCRDFSKRREGKITEDQEDLNISLIRSKCPRVTINTKERKVLVTLDPPGFLFPGFGHQRRFVLFVPVP